MQKITQKMVKEVKAHDRRSHHDADWWRFEKMGITTAIQTAIHACGPGATVKEIAADSNRP